MICQKTSHGSALSCSQAGCRQAGIKFLYCLHCGIPVAKKTFWKRHNHDEQPAQLKDTPIENGEHHSSQHIPVANVPMDDGARKRETNKRTVPSTGQESAPVKRARTCYHQPSHDSRKGVSASPENSSFEHSSRSSRPDRSSERADVSRNLSSHPRSQIGSITEREEEWVVLLRSRPTPDDSPEFLDWVTRVLRTSSNKKNSAGSDSSGESTLSNSQPGLSSMDEQSSSSQEENQSNSFSSATGTSESGGSSTDDSSSTTSNERKRRVQVFSSSSSDEGSSSEDLPSSSNERIGNRVTDSSGEDSRQKVAGN